ncbi:hypothetical protein HBI26_002010 [Parastagonospora nodorum]|nr:hypothetical protein HBH52_001890 [Parastagonospora nodorum]KAH4613593.1 hypothetical protein HBH82_013900 [Parastagonospora nodorum]KAH4713565.1 hypothetical protein HBH67_001890 [Parastagonospora nodorum]KAH4727991.1 hypothetical protein HBH78_021180 [Parastagonospora nodorum]KAH4792520.1 hypothetical protein HBH62_017080 [Parastagonospora nodorum]
MVRVGKRKRASTSEEHDFDGDTIAVVPRQAVAVQVSSVRLPLLETQSQANVPRRRTASRIRTSHPTAASPVPPSTIDNVPASCCYFCRGRGGNADQECVFAGGDDPRCTRCIRDKKKRCRPATAEEIRAFAARCERCKIRGFKLCNGQRPHCDTCERNNTQHICWRPRPQANGENPQASAAVAVASEAPTPAPRPSRKRRKVVTEAHDIAGTCKEAAMAIDDQHGQVDAATSRPENDDTDETVIANTTEEIAIVGLHVQLDAADVDSVIGDDGVTSNISLSFPERSPVRRAMVTDVTSVTEDDDEDQIQRETRAMNLVFAQELRDRARCSRPRVSYVEPIPDIFSDQEMDTELVNEDDDSDVYESSASSPESLPDEEFEFEDLPAEQSSATEEDGATEDDEVVSVTEIQPSKPKAKPRAQKKASGASEGKGIDFSLPPIDSVEDAFADMAAKALELGLDNALRELEGHQIKVATMCSGTESPLLAFELFSKALEQSGHSSLRVHQKFAAEIEVFKQAFIERNQAPEIIFRDVREFISEDATTAITAYGAEEHIPSGLDVLIAGFVCKDLSRLNTRQKGLEDNGESGDTWRAIYAYAKRFRPSIVLLENVKGLSKLWEGVVSMWDKIGYEAAWLIRDTKRYRIPQTRERMYMIAIERSHYGKDVKKAVAHWQDLMDNLQRQCSSPYEAWLKNMLHESSEHCALGSEVDWALCKLRYDHIRSDERLGILRPVTKWSENGTVKPPDFANRAWYSSQSSRVYDAIDVAYLQAAQKGHDAMYKMAVLDVSQNVDRFKNSLGILPCITPGGCDFATNRQEALSGKQLLLLQGMPLNKLLFGTETQKECQDLAGNAMTTTVIGASIISAIICGWRAFRFDSPRSSAPHKTSALPLKEHIRISSPKVYELGEDDTDKIDLGTLRHEACLSARLCNCEGEKSICKYTIRVCSGCGHTACEKCAGNPKHCYDNNILRSNRKQTPNDFVQEWRPKLATRFTFDSFPDVRQLASKASEKILKPFLDHVIEIDVKSQQFCFRDMLRRHNGWSVIYGSHHATLELCLGHKVEWFLFLNCPSEIAGNDPLRKQLLNPIARAKVIDSLLDVQWEFRLPSIKKHSLQVNSLGSRCSSWRSRLGLLDYKSETVPMSLQVASQSRDCKNVIGEFELLPDCGTASSSLYKRTIGPDLYLFLDPTLLGGSDTDAFTFSEDCSQKSYGESRISVIDVEATWRPWQIHDEAVHDVEATLPAIWTSVSMKLQPVNTAFTVSVPATAASLRQVEHDCSRALTVLEARVPERLPDVSKHSWVLERVKRLPTLSAWQPTSLGSLRGCACAPVYPPILWHINDKGIASPQEARKAAAEFERAVKTRAPIFSVNSSFEKGITQIVIAINAAALVHRARGRLPRTSSTNTMWRLYTDHAELPSEPFPKFRLLSNANDPPCALSSSIAYLRNAQPRALSWMETQELGKELTITEVEEAVHANLGWRAEARAEAVLSVRGGVLADLPSFGKTVTTIALIQSEFEDYAPKALLQRNKTLNEGTEAFLDTAGTLIACPGHIALQWRTELEKFLGKAEYEKYSVIVVQTFAELQKLDIDDIRRSRVVVVAWSVFAEEEYISHLAHFSAMPEPNVTGRRAFDTWFEQASQDIPRQLAAFESSNFSEFKKSTQDLLEKRLQHEDFKATLPIKIQHGSAYQSVNIKSKSNGKRNAPSKLKLSKPPKSTHQVPLLHLFRFNRVVVDEYHYLNDDKKMGNILASVSVKRIAAVKRWVLSGTPALKNFSDVDQIASYLGIRLGRYHFGDGIESSSSDKMRRGDQTLVEEFLSQTETMSRQWHKARHERAQEFLDIFVRRNEPCLAHVACIERITPSEIDIGHLAVYLELLQYVGSHGMAIKRLKNKTPSDKIERLNASLNYSATAEDALLKCALLFRTSEGTSALAGLTTLRSSQRNSVQSELRALLAGFEDLKKSDEISDLYDRFKQDITEHNWLGDEYASRVARNMLIKAKKAPNSSAFPELKGSKTEQKSKFAKKLLSDLRETARDLAHLIRSERFIKAINDLMGPLTKRENGQAFTCSHPDCDGMARLSQLRLITHCGHTACEGCLSTRTDVDKCVDPMCSLFVQGVNLVKVTDLGSRTEPASERYFGRKMEDVIKIISRFPRGDQGVIFAPNDETVEILEEVLDSHGVAYHSLRGCRGATSAKIIEDFKTNDDPDDQSKVLILNMGSESAAGANLVNANHLIFVAPLLAKTQYEYDSAMAQAIARLRRYMQTKTVHIYHVIAQRTIDVDILEHRHKRVDGITTSESPMKMPKAQAKKEKTKLVKNNNGQMALIPVSWLADESKRKMLGVDEAPESFASLINFSDTFQHDEDWALDTK